MILSNKLDQMLVQIYNESPQIYFDSQKFMALDEATKEKISDNISIASLKTMTIKLKSTKFDDITKSKGDFKKMVGYQDFKSVLTFLEANKSKGQSSYKNMVKTLDDLEKIIDKYKPSFKKAYSNKDYEELQLIYTGLVIALVESTLLVFRKSFKPAKAPDGNKILALQSAKYNSKMIKTAEKMVEADKKGNIKKSIEAVEGKKIKNEGAVKEIAVAASFAFFALASLIALIRFSILYLFKARNSLADMLKYAANTLTEVSTVNSNKKIQTREKNWADRYRKWADKVEVSDKVAETGAQKEIARIDAKAGQDGMRSSSSSLSDMIL